jgi:hypothetical protein
VQEQCHDRPLAHQEVPPPSVGVDSPPPVVGSEPL